MISLPIFDPVALEIGPLQIRWYSLAYIAGILFTLFWLKNSNKKEKYMSQDAYDNWITWAVFSILLGGRIGYVLFYNFSYFLSNPLEIFAFWHGGMSFHGGLFGAIIGMFLFAKKYKINFLTLTDNLAIAAPVGLFFGRIANFINLELYGHVTSSKFGMIFPNGGPLPRHPSQLYEAFLEGLILFLILFSLNKFTKIKEKPGILSGLLLIFYAIFRMIIENFRQPDEQLGYIFAKITMGQILSLPIVILGFLVIFFALKKTKLSSKKA